MAYKVKPYQMCIGSGDWKALPEDPVHAIPGGEVMACRLERHLPAVLRYFGRRV